MMKDKDNIEFIDERQERSELKKFGTIKGLLAGSLLSKDKIARQLPYILFVTLLAFIYISNQYHAEKIMRKNSILQDQVKELRAKSISTSAELMQISKQSEVIKLINKKNLDLKESRTPPKKVVVKKK
ncbi:MAG: FtsL-like putative cell division protein [Bacteroidales bacterium]